MFRDMRRSKQMLTQEETEQILYTCTYGVMAVHGDNGYPYAVPISYIYHRGHIYAHSAISGHKIDGINKNNKVSFTVIGKDDIMPKKFTTYFSSVIAFGKARIISDEEEKRRSLVLLSEKYSPDFEEEMKKEISKSMSHLVMIDIEIEHMTGKIAKELAKNK